MTAGRGPRHAGRKGGAPVRKSITTRYFYSTAVLLICSIAVMGFIQMYLAMGYFREENGTALIQTIDNAILAMQEAADDGIVEKRAEAAEAAGLDVEDIKRGITLTARAAGKSILVTDAYGSVVLSIPSEYQGMEVSVKTCNATYSRGIYDEMGTLGGIFSSRYYIAGKPILDEKGMLQGFVFAGANADSLTEYLANLFSTFILSAGLMLMVSSVLSIVLTNRMTTPLRRISDAAKKFGGGDFSARVPVEGDDELAQLAKTFNTMAGSLEKIDQSRRSFMGNIAHELRTPMTTIKGFIDGMLDGTIPPENQNHYLGIVSQEVGRLTRLIKNMLDITKLEAGEYKVNATTYEDIKKNGGKVVTNGFDDIANMVKDGQIDVFVWIGPGEAWFIVDVSGSVPLKFLNIESGIAKKVAATLGCNVGTLPAEFYKGKVGPDVTTLWDTNAIIVRDNLDEESAYRLTQAVIEGRDDIALANPAWKSIDPAKAWQGTVYPLHPGAARYYKEKGYMN